MASKQNKFNPKIKYYHIIILSCFLTFFLILNSNYVNKQREKEKLNKEKTKLFNKIISSRKLEGEGEEKRVGVEESQPKTDSDKVCAKGSESLVQYYQTGKLELIELDDGPIESKEKDKDYFKALIKIVQQFTDDSKEDEINPDNDAPLVPIRNLQSIDDMKDDIITYGMHLLPILIFLAVGILCIPGWIVCCACCCCNCCCCCCCKKPGCKIPCFIFTYVFYALSIALCIYGLSQSNNIFVGLADTECSLLKFLDQVLEGETKQEKPRWPGIQGINDVLDDLVYQIKDMKNGTKGELNGKITQINNAKVDFLGKMKDSGDKFLTGDVYKTDYKGNYYHYSSTGIDINDVDYVLDIVKMFGRYNTAQEKFLPEKSTLDLWKQEYSTITEKADEYLNIANDGFNDILDGNVDDLTRNLDNGREQLDGIKGSFDDIKGNISEVILDYSETIDYYGKLGFNTVFSVLGLINIALGVFILLICLCSGKMCTNCCCCRCLCKLMTHLLWNILALLMIIIFLVGSSLSLIGQVGSDAMSLISFIVSKDNTDNLIIGQLGDSKVYLDKCINGDGDIVSEIGLEDKIDSFCNISDVENQIITVKRNFTNLKDNPPLYTHYYYEIFKKRVDLSDKTLSLIPVDTNNLEQISNPLNFEAILLKLNTNIKDLPDSSHNIESWDVNGDQTITCSNGDTQIYTNPIKFHPQKCPPFYRNWIQSSNNNIKGPADIITDTIKFLNKANSNDEDSYKKIINDLKDEYEVFLNNYIDALGLFNKTINKITNKINEYTGEGNGLFDFIKCNFIGTNLKIILKYLKTALGSDIYTVGICLLVVGCSLILSISSTILLIVVINVSIDDNKKKLKEKNKEVSDNPLNSERRAFGYKY